ncbi:unnamed protein product, partial [Discosporangium mesarthrocarpum]
LVFALYCFSTAFSRGIENCTMGDTDSYLMGVIYGVPLTAGSLALFWRARNAFGWPRTARFAASPIGVALLWLLIPWVASTTLAGNHSCGPDYNSYLAYARGIDRFVPLIHVGFVLAIWI